MPDPIKRATVLVVDDIPANVAVLAEGISDQYEVLFATSGPECLDEAERHQPDLILLDLFMPEMDGFEVCRHLRYNPVTRDIPIIVVTASEDTATEIRALEEGATDFVTKPVSMPVLRARLRHHLLRRRAMQQLQASEEKFQILADWTFDWEYWINPEDHVVYMTPSVERITGYTAKDFIEHPTLISALVHPDDLTPWIMHRAEEQGDKLHEIELRIRTRDGQHKWVSHICRPIIDREGRYQGRRVTNRDITERKRIEAEIAEARDQFASLVSNIPGATYRCIADSDWTMLYMSEAIATLTGYPPTHFINNTERSFASVITPEDAGRVEQTVQQAISERRPWEIEYRIQHRDGRQLWVYEKGRAIFDKGGSVAFLDGFILDISARKQAELALKEEQTRLSTILWGTGVGTWEWNVQTGEARFNERWAELVGYRLEELAPISIDTWTRLAHPDDLAKSGEELARHFAGEQEYYECEVRLLHRDGHWIWVVDRGRVVSHTPDGKPEWMVGTHWEITARKQAELDLQTLNHTLEDRVAEETRKALEKEHLLAQQSRHAAMGEMIGNITHQWRQPLNAMNILLANIQDDLAFGELTPERMTSHVEKGTHLVKRMATTIEDFRNFFRPGKEKSEFSPAEPVREVKAIIGEILTRQGITLEEEMDEQARVFGVANEFSQVMLNLVNNAREAIAQNRVHPGVIRITVNRREEWIEVQVSDNGGGIPPDVLPRVFDSYFTTKEKGTGIGLYMSRLIIENMNGSLSAANNNGGALFTVMVPACEDR